MGKYLVQLSLKALQDLKDIKKSGRKSDLKKIQELLLEIEEEPRKGLGLPEHLKYFKNREIWSRRLNQKNRLVYEIFETDTLIVVIQALGHYSDK